MLPSMFLCVPSNKSVVSLCIAASLAFVTACGGGGGGGGASPPTTVSPPPPPPPPSGISFDVSGTASKGLIFGGAVRVVDANDPTFEIATGTTSTVDGSYTLSVSPNVDFEGGIVKVIISGGTGVTMVCDAPYGCGATPFGDNILIDDNFQISALADASTDGEDIVIHVNAITTLATRLIEHNSSGSEIDATAMNAVYENLASLFEFENSALTSIAGFNIAEAGTGSEPSADQLRAAYLNAGIFESIMEGSGTMDERLEALISDFVANDGTLILNEAVDNPDLVSVEDIVENAIAAISTSPRTGANQDAFSQTLQASYFAVSAAPAGIRGSVLPVRPVLAVDSAQFALQGILGQSTDTVQMQISGPNVPWRIDTIDPKIDVSPQQGVGDTTVTITGIASRMLVGDSTGALTVRDTESPNAITVLVDFTIGDVLSTDAVGAQTFFSVNGATAPVSSAFNVQGQDVSFDVTSDQSWLTTTQVSNTSPTQVTINVDPSGLSEGKHIGNLDIADTNFSQTAFVQVEIDIEPRMLLVEELGVGLHDFPSSSILTRDVMITETLGGAVDWRAVSSEPWLTINESGQTGNALNIQADPTGLATDQLHYALITVQSDDPTISNAELIDVAFWIGSTDPASRIEINRSANYIAAHPAYPWLYVTADGETDIEIYNVFTGQSVGSYTNVTTNNGPMTFDKRGQILSVHDQNNYNIVSIDITAPAGYGTLPSVRQGFMISSKIGGHEILFTDSGKAYNPRTGLEVNVTGGSFSTTPTYRNTIAVNKSGTKICTINQGISPYSLICHDVAYSGPNSNTLRLSNRGNVSHGVGSNGRDVALSHDGTLVYASSGSPYQFNVFDTTTIPVMPQVQTLPGTNYPNIAEVGPNGIFYGGVDGYYATTDVWAYDTQGNSVGTYEFAGYGSALASEQLVVSADGSRIIGATQDGRIVILGK